MLKMDAMRLILRHSWGACSCAKELGPLGLLWIKRIYSFNSQLYEFVELVSGEP